MFIMLLFRNTKTWFESMVGSEAKHVVLSSMYRGTEHVFFRVYRQDIGTNRTVQLESVTERCLYSLRSWWHTCYFKDFKNQSTMLTV